MSVFFRMFMRPQTWLGPAHAAPPDVRSGHPALHSLDTGWRSAILAPLASDAGESAWAAPRGIHPNDSARKTLPLPLGEGRGEGAFRRSTERTLSFSLSHWERAGVRVPFAARQTHAAFTLVELLVVIGILSILAALVTPAIFQARVSARNAAIKAEIDMLHMAIMNYKNEYGSFPPCYDANTTVAVNGPAVKHLRRIFPRCSTINAQFSASGLQPANKVHPANALHFWLGGYTGDSESPLVPKASRKRLYDFDKYRTDSYGLYLAPNARETPYLYFDSSRYLTVNGQAGTGLGNCPAVFRVWREDGPTGVGEFLESDGFIILSAGLDGEFYTADDISNAWKGTWENWNERLQ